MYGGKLMFGQHDDQSTPTDNTAAIITSPTGNLPVDKPDEPIIAPTSPAMPVENGGDNLLEIKQHALSQLSPLVTHLDQSPEERFRTIMMMIQASDNQALIQSAYDAASQMGDDKQKAQALLDIVNEINYFTHPQPNDKK